MIIKMSLYTQSYHGYFSSMYTADCGSLGSAWGEVTVDKCQHFNCHHCIYLNTYIYIYIFIFIYQNKSLINFGVSRLIRIIMVYAMSLQHNVPLRQDT